MEKTFEEDRKPVTQSQKPSAKLKALDKLVGLWNIEGDTVQGRVSFEWMEGGFFLRQNIYIQFNDQPIIGLEIIGQEQTPGEFESKGEIRSRFFDNGGNILDYVYELEGKNLTIWAQQRNSSAYYKGVFSDDFNSIRGIWIWPGGGYESTMVKEVSINTVL